MLDKGMICAVGLFRGFGLLNLTLREVSVGNVKGTQVTEVVNGKWFLISFLNPANVRMLASWLDWVLLETQCHKGGKAIIFATGNGHSP